MMKLAFSSLGCPGWSYEQLLDEAARDGYAGLEIRGVGGEMRADKIDCFAIGRQQDARRAAQERGVKLIGFGASASFHDPANLENALGDAFAAVDVAAALGMSFVRVFGDRIAPEDDERAVIARVADGIKEVCRYAEGAGVTVLQECHGNFNSADRLLAVAERVGCANYGILWDVAHSDKIYGDRYEEFYAAVRPLVRHVHFKDHVRGNGAYALCDTGAGDIPLIPILRLLEKDGYSGHISLEWEKTWHPELRDAREELPHFVRYIREHM